jgi:hypothetical protein
MSLSILDVEPEGPSYDLTGIVTHECMCGSNLWHIVATFEDYDIAMYFEDMQCVACGSRAQAPCPLDDPCHEA